jgi:hypothetical protein
MFMEATMKTQHGRDLSGEDMAVMLDEFCNGASDKDYAAFAAQVVTRTHRTLQQRIMSLMIRTIEEWSVTDRFDGRNEATVTLARKIVTATGDKYDRHLPLV